MNSIFLLKFKFINNFMLTELYLDNNNIDECDCSHLSEYLWMTSCHLIRLGLEFISDALLYNKSLKFLNLDDCYIDGKLRDQHHKIFKMLELNNTLEELTMMLRSQHHCRIIKV